MTKPRALLPQQCKIEQAVILGQATGPSSPVISLKQPETDAWKMFKNKTSTCKISLRPPTAQGLLKPAVPPMHLVTPSNWVKFSTMTFHMHSILWQGVSKHTKLPISSVLTKQTGRSEKHKRENTGKGMIKDSEEFIQCHKSRCLQLEKTEMM